MTDILFLCHRIPFPPDKGDKIRSFNWLRSLSEQYTVHVGSFVDDPDDWQHQEALAAFCGSLCLRPLSPRRAKLRSLTGLFRHQALSFAYYRDAGLQAWVDRLIREHDIDAVLVFCSTMAPYVLRHGSQPRILDFVDVDSDKWAQYAQHARGPMRWVYSREARLLGAAERRLARTFDASVFVSETEAEFFRRTAPDCADRVHGIANGVDTVYFDNRGEYPDPGHGDARIVFTGAMDYGANVDAVCWFAEAVWPKIRQACPDARFTIVGTKPTRRVLALAETDGIEVTGAVADVRPYLAHASVAVAPMRIARGLQNKVLEALAMACPVVMTPQAQAGLATGFERVCHVAETADVFAEAVVDELSKTSDPECQQAARRYVKQYYAWSARVAELKRLLSVPMGSSLAESVA